MYKITYDLSSDKKEKLEYNVHNNYDFIVENIGTEFNTVIRTDMKEQIEKIETVTQSLKDYFVGLFYNQRVQTFTFRFLENNFYDPYMIEFLIRNNIINFTGSDYLCIIHKTPLKSNFSFL